MKTARLCYLALLACLGLVLPAFFHIVGGTLAGSIFLPLHIPVLLAALVLGAGEGFFMGLFLPVLSSFITGMPPAAILPLMMTELSLYGLLCGVLKKITKRDGISLIIALILGRAVYAALLAVLFYVFNLNVAAFLALIMTFIKGLPGIIIQLSLVPPLCAVVRRYTFARYKTTVKQT